MTCEHYACRCARAAELAATADRTGNGRHLVAAVHVHSERVECRLYGPAVIERERAAEEWAAYLRDGNEP